MTKNHREDDDEEGGGVTYAIEGTYCPVAYFEKYLQHSNPDNELLFQRPNKKVKADSVVWYDNMVVGEHLFEDMMHKMSKKVQLSLEYINHSIRATSVTILDKAGFEARHIMCGSAHRYESSVRSYSKTDDTTKRKMSETLTAMAASTAPRDSEVVSENVASTVSQVEPLSPLLPFSLSQEECLRDVHLSSQTQVSTSKHYKFHNCNSIFNN